MKRFIALLTMFVLLAGMFQFSGVVYAEEKAITLKQAIEFAKKGLSLKTDGFEFNSSYTENQNGYNLWVLNWNNTKTNNESISVSIDASNGEIVSVYWYTPYQQPTSRIPKYSKDQALKAAQEWAAKLQGAKFKLTKLNTTSQNDYYSKYADVFSFEFVRVQDGVPVSPNTISVQLDKNTLKLRSFNIIWDKQSLPSKAKAFGLDKAKEYFMNKLGLELTYNLVYSGTNNEPKVVLAYTLKNGNAPIDAISGELLKNMYRVYYGLEKGSADMAAPQSTITPEEQNELEKNNNYISKADAEQAVLQHIKLDENMKLERANLYPGYNKMNAAWSLEWRYTDVESKAYKYIYAQVDAVTKELRSFNSSNSNEKLTKDMTAMTKEQAKKLAEEFLNKIQPEKFKKTQYRETTDLYGGFGIMPPYQNGYSFNYIRVENGIPFPSNSLNITVNEYTGEVTNYNYNWMNITLPAPSKVISLEKAYEILFSKVKFEMQYLHHYPDMNNYDKREMKLAYALENINILIDANSGTMINYDGTPVKPVDKVSYTDIKGNKAEEEIKLLVEMSILIPEGTKYQPNAKMLQKDFIKLLVSSLQDYYQPMPAVKAEAQYDNVYAEAIRRKIITAADKKPEAVVTRQDAAKMIIRAMNFGVVAEKSNMFALNFKDAKKIKTSYKGYIAMAAEFGIITPVKSYFNPTNSITRGDAAEFIVNYLKCDTSL